MLSGECYNGRLIPVVDTEPTSWKRFGFLTTTDFPLWCFSNHWPSMFIWFRQNGRARGIVLLRYPSGASRGERNSCEKQQFWLPFTIPSPLLSALVKKKWRQFVCISCYLMESPFFPFAVAMLVLVSHINDVACTAAPSICHIVVFGCFSIAVISSVPNVFFNYDFMTSYVTVIQTHY